MIGEKGVVSGVKDQKSCKSGWAFSSISTIKSASRISGQGNNLISEQQLIDWSDTSQSNNFKEIEFDVFYSIV